MDQISEILESMETLDVHGVWKGGMSPDTARQIAVLCEKYREMDSGVRAAMRSAVSRKAGWFILAFVSRMALVAVREKDREALANGILALILSKTAEVDYRDAYKPIAKLAYAARQCGVDLAEYSMETCPETPVALIGFMRKPGPVKVGPDADGNLVFQVTDETLARGGASEGLVGALRKKRAASKAKPTSQ